MNGAANSTTGGVTTVTPMDNIKFTGTGNTLNLTDTGPAASLKLTDLTVSGVQTLNLGSNTGLNGGVADVSGFTGLTQANFSLGAPAAAQTITAAGTTNVSLAEAGVVANGTTVQGGANVAVTETGVTRGTITVGSSKAPTGTVTVTDNSSASATTSTGAINVTGGTTVAVTDNITNTAAATADTTVAGGAVAVTGGAATTTVSVTQTAAAAATVPVAAAAQVTELNFSSGTSTNGGPLTVVVNGTTFTTAPLPVAAKPFQAAAAVMALVIPGVTLTGGAAGIVNITSTAAGTAFTVGTVGGPGSVGYTEVTTPITPNKVAVTGVSGIADGAVTIADPNQGTTTASTITTATLDGYGAGSTVKSDALTTLTMNNSANDVTVTDASTKKTLGLTVSNLATGASLAASGAFTTVNVTTGAKASVLALTAANMTALNVAGTSAIKFSNTASAMSANLATLNASSNSGGVTVTDNLAGLVLTGGSGNDVVTLSAALTTTSGGTINLGGGNNTLLAGAGGSIGTGVVVDGGTGGTNTISATLVNAGSAATIKDFQVLDVSGFGSGAGNGALDTSLMSTSVSGVSISSAATAGTATLLNLGANITVTDSADNTSSSLVLTHAAGAGTLAINFASSAATTAGPTIISSLTSTGDTAVTISSLGTDTTTPAANTLTHLFETDNHLTTVTITGANPFTLGGVTTDSSLATGTAGTPVAVASTLTLIDGSTATGALTITAGATSTDGNVNTTTTYTGLTIKGGTGGDTITNHAANGVITEGATASTLVNTLTVDGSGATINDSASAGNDVITLSGSNDAATLGSGASTVTVSANNAATSDIVTVNLVSGAGATVTDSLLYASAAGNQTASTTYDLVTLGGTALHANNLAFSAAIATPAGALGAATSVASAQTFDQAVFVALGGTMGGAASTTTTHAINTVDWFQYAGNTYIVDAGGTAPGIGAAATAEVVKVVGVVDLSHATIAAGGAHITFA